MSSDTSSSSKFGLYRTIDARTEEFLRLSRKRQMRQGCVCAAISTAITVTVVISIVLIYEYININNENSRKSNWLGLMNQTLDSLPFDTSQINKEKLNFDRSTIELLPILLKAFKRNKYYDKETDDNNSSNSNNDTKDTTEYSRNIFSDARNWMKMPPSRVYAIEYKTSPIIYFKSPTRNIDYFTKIRKIRDYKRIMNYVDKMISDKVTGPTQSLLRRDYNVQEKPFLYESITSVPKTDIKTTYYRSDKKTNPSHKNKNTNCNCSTKVSEVLRKIISSLQNLLPYFMNNTETVNPCDMMKTKPMTGSYDPSIVAPHTSSTSDILTQNIATSTVPYRKPSVIHEIQKEKSSQPLSSDEYFYSNNKSEPTFNTMIKLLKPKNPKGHMVKNSTYYGMEKFRSYYHLNDMFSKFNKSQKNQFTNTTVQSNTSYIFDRNKKQENKTYIISKLNPIPYDNTFTDNTENTTNIVDLLDILNTDSFELMKKYIVSGRSSKSENITTISEETDTPIWDTLVTEKVTSFTSPRLSSPKIVKNIKDNTNNLNMAIINETRTNIDNIKHKTTEQSLTNNVYKKPVNDSQPKENTGVELWKTTNENIREDLTIEEDMEGESEEYSDEDNPMRNIENILKSFKNDTSPQKFKNRTVESSEMYQWELVKIKEHAKNLSDSLKTQNRPTYLEIQRNDWKHEDNLEYDVNINNYIFD